MDIAEETYTHALEWKLKGGLPVEVFVSDSTWLGGRTSRDHTNPSLRWVRIIGMGKRN